ncbi:MAG: preprotein translocase subunit SecG [Phycisphaerae bacterium]|nr:preprotein translocase subunit SecG [Phycisphaerae bacterium]
MSTWIIILTIAFIIIAVAMILIILVQRPHGGGLSGAFGGAGGGGTDTAFGGRTGDALTVATIGAFVLYLLVAISLNIIDTTRQQSEGATTVADTTPAQPVSPVTQTSPGITINPPTSSEDLLDPGLDIQPATTPAPTPAPSSTDPAGDG